MTYAKTLPQLHDLFLVAKAAHPFPVESRVLQRVAKKLGLGKSAVDFLKLFPDDERFESRADFLTRCDELEMFIAQERESPKEHLRSLQD